MPFDGISNAWHPTKLEFSEFELLGQLGDFDKGRNGRLHHAKHPLFGEKKLFMKIAPWPTNWWRRAIENETKAYQLVEGHGIAPEFLGHVTYRGTIIGFIVEWIEGAEEITKKDKNACIEAIKKLHALGITHGTAHWGNFLKRGNDMLVIDFDSSKFGDQATAQRKKDDIQSIKRFGHAPIYDSDDDDDDDDDDFHYTPDVDKFFDAMSDDEINWTDDSQADIESDDDSEDTFETSDNDGELGSVLCSCPRNTKTQDPVEQTTGMS
ncbi:hypothetical protein F5Y14DRAFT_400860 [Nemania sp. NC0429]|nr:hypothetical protein F5Y14DRAFT_400860 [Nemania sp. NC0429]